MGDSNAEWNQRNQQNMFKGELGSSNLLLSCKLEHFSGLHIWVF
jgi:hypothetical protein